MLQHLRRRRKTPAWIGFLQKRDEAALEEQRKVDKTVATAALWQAVELILV